MNYDLVKQHVDVITAEQVRGARDCAHLWASYCPGDKRCVICGTVSLDELTPEKVRERRAVDGDRIATNRNSDAACGLFRFALVGLLKHPGVNSAARAVIEAALE